MTDFTGILSLSFNQLPEFLGNDTHPHRIKKTITIKGLGVGGTTLSAEPFKINGTLIGTGDISYAFDKSVENFNSTEFQTATVITYDDGFASYLGLGSLQNIQSLDETFQTSYTEEGFAETSHNVNVIPKNTSNLLSLGKSISTTLRRNYSSVKSYFQETFDLQNGKYQFVETSRSFPLIGVYSTQFSYSIVLGENGITSIAEKCDIKGLNLPIATSAETGLTTEIDNAYSRCFVLFGATAGRYPLNIQFISKQIFRNKFLGTISYNIVFNNDPSLQSNYSWEYSTTIETNELGISNVVEEGTIRGYGRTRDVKYSNALAGYNTKIADIYSRVQIYASNLKSTPVIKNLTKSQFQGMITYSQTFTNDPEFLVNDLFTRQEVTLENQLPVSIYQKYAAYGKKQIIQYVGTTSVGKSIMNINLVGKRSTAVLQDFLNKAKSLVNITDGCIISNCSWNFDPQNYRFGFSISYDYFGTEKVTPPLPQRR